MFRIDTLPVASSYDAAKNKFEMLVAGYPFDLQHLERAALEEIATTDADVRRHGCFTIEQACVNYLRQRQSNYVTLLHMLDRPDDICTSQMERHVLHVERRRLAALVKKRILDEIATKYPWLAKECARQKARDGVEDKPGDFEMPFGPFKGQRLRDIDSDYLIRLLGQCDVRRAFRTRIERYLAERDAARNSHVGAGNGCPDCGAAIGQPHKDNCDIQRCSSCGQQRVSCDCDDHEPAKSVWTGDWPVPNEKPSFLGVAILARRDHTRPVSIDNCFWRTAVSEDEARIGRELYVGEELRKRLLELESQGWIDLPVDGRMILNELVGGGATT